MKFLYLLVSAFLFVLSFSPFDHKISIFLSIIILFFIVDNLSTKERSKYLFFFAIMIHLIGVSWVSESLITYGSMGYIISYAITLFFIIIISIPYALIGYFYKPIRKNNIFNINFIAILFILVEFVKSSIFGGFPWLLIGYTQNGTVFDYIYPILGTYAVSYIIIFTSAIIYQALYMRPKKYVVTSLILVVIYLSFPLSNDNSETYVGKKISFALYQPNIYPNISYNSDEYKNTVNKYISVIDNNKSKDLLIFPETIIPKILSRNNSLYKKMESSTGENNILITGLFTKNKNNYFNSMLFFSDDIEIYNKRKLVPFGEYTPWYDTVIKLSQIIDIPLSNLSPGSNNQKEIMIKNIKIIPMICFESTFPSLIHSDSENEIIINISNDGWFGNTLAPYQHLQITQIRALEFNRFILRATNTGISAVIDNHGKILDFIGNNEEGIIQGNVPLKNKRSIYSQYGDISILMLLFLSLLLTGLTGVIKRNE